MIDCSRDVIFGNTGDWRVGGEGGHLEEENVPPQLNIRMFLPLLVTFSPVSVSTAPLYLNQTLMRLVLRYNEGCVGSSKTVLNLNKID